MQYKRQIADPITAESAVYKKDLKLTRRIVLDLLGRGRETEIRSRRIETTAFAGVASNAFLDYFEENGVAVAIRRYGYYRLSITARFAFFPDLSTASAVIMGDTSLNRQAQRLGVHIRKHKRLVRKCVASDDRNETFLVVIDFRGVEVISRRFIGCVCYRLSVHNFWELFFENISAYILLYRKKNVNCFPTVYCGLSYFLGKSYVPLRMISYFIFCRC